jgi:transposase
MRSVEMLTAREILKLKYEKGLTTRDIAASAGCSKSSVSNLIKRAEKAGLTWPVNVSDIQLMQLLYPAVQASKAKTPEPDMNYVYRELKRKGVTLMLLWEEYKEQNPDGLMYTQFCDRYREFKKSNKLEMHKEHTGGEMEVDWAGSTIPYCNPTTGEVCDAYIFVAVLPASHYPFIRAYDNMQIANWIDAHVRAYDCFGGVPKITIPDNTKTAVIKAHRFNPTLNRNYMAMAAHYRTTIVPARSRTPKDKGSVENLVGNVTRRILAPLRNRQFFSVAEINDALGQGADKFISEPFQKMEGNRKSLFEQIDKPALMPLPATTYEYADWKEAKAGFNYHVEYDKFHYSVPYSYAGKLCWVRATAKTIEIYIGSERIAAHPRNCNTLNRYTTLLEHMPDNHKAVSKWNADRFLAWAEKTGPNTKQFIQLLLESREHPVQAYKAAMGILNLTNDYSSGIMEKAALEAVANNTVSYKYFSLIVNQLSREQVQPEKIIENTNVRGKSSFAAGGVHVN